MKIRKNKKDKIKEHISLSVDETTDEYVVHISKDFRIQEAVILFAKLAKHQGKTYSEFADTLKETAEYLDKNYMGILSHV